MDCIPEDKILQFHPDTMVSIRKLYNLDKPGEMDEAIDLLDDWIKKQKHFNKTDYSREYLERTIILLKGSVERAKAHIDKLCTLKTLLPNYFNKHDPKNDFKEARKFYAHALLPKLTEDNYRIYTGKFLQNGINAKLFLDCYKFGTILCEYIKAHEYCNGYVAIMDYRDISVAEALTVFNPMEFHHLITIIMQGYGMRIKGIHVLTPSKTIQTLINMVRGMFGTKVGNRIYVHTNLETLYDYFPKEILPVEYGGYERSVVKLCDEWIDVLSTKENIEYTAELSKADTNEAYRQTDKFNETYMGMAGTFRTLSVD